MKIWLCIVFSLCITLQSQGQEDIEGLEASFEDRNTDTLLISDYLLVASHYTKIDSSKTHFYLTKAFDAATLLKNNTWRGKVLYQIGRFHIQWGYELDQAIIYYQQALEIFRKERVYQDELELTVRLGACYLENGQDAAAFDLFNDALERNQDDDKYGVVINNSIGTMMKSIGEYEKAIEYMDLSESHFFKLKNPKEFVTTRQISNHKNRGVVYRELASYDTAKYYFDQGLELSVSVQDSTWMASIYNSMGIMYERQNLFLEAIDAFEKSLEIKRSENYDDGVVTSLTNIGGLYSRLGEYKKAETLLLEAQSVYNNGNCRPDRLVNVLKVAAELYYETGRYKLAYENYYSCIELKDSLSDVKNAKFKQELEAEYQNDVLAAQEEKLKAELIAADLREEGRKAELKKANTMRVLGISFTIILLIFMAITIRANLKRKAINKSLILKNDEIIQKSDKIELQKIQIEEKSQEIHDSITYAKRIQQAILPNLDFVSQHLPHNFIYYQPKEILAGDFYWFDVVENLIIWAAADCTGHGIPGAMVSVVCHNALNRSVHEFGNTEPGKILDCTRELVIETFVKSGMEVKDGMDISLCCFNKKTNTLKFAGANNPLWLIRKTTEIDVQENELFDEHKKVMLKEIKGDKQPIGLHYTKTPFVTSEVPLQKGDQLFVFTDGFSDQFGGDKGKKLKAANFKNLLLSLVDLSPNEQKSAIHDAFESWKGPLEQVDDVCVIGVRL